MNTIDGPKAAYDFAGLGSLKAKAANDPKSDEAINKVAKQFEALFLQMMLKSMRDATPKGGLFDSKATETFEELYDKQLVAGLSERGETGIAKMVADYIKRSHGADLTNTDEKFFVGNADEISFPLVNESDVFKIPEGSTQQFFLNRNRFSFEGGE